MVIGQRLPKESVVELGLKGKPKMPLDQTAEPKTPVFTMSLVACTFVILNEIKQGLRMKDIASSYGMAIVSEARGADNPDWKTINAAIVERWGGRGLSRVKNAAWRLVNGGP
jgi:hypothetical protein